MSRTIVVALLCLTMTKAALAQSEPIQSPQDAACRDEAKAHVYSAPNPKGLSLYNLGAQIYRDCMRRNQASGDRTRRQRAP